MPGLMLLPCPRGLALHTPSCGIGGNAIGHRGAAQTLGLIEQPAALGHSKGAIGVVAPLRIGGIGPLPCLGADPARRLGRVETCVHGVSSFLSGYIRCPCGSAAQCHNEHKVVPGRALPSQTLPRAEAWGNPVSPHPAPGAYVHLRPVGKNRYHARLALRASACNGPVRVRQSRSAGAADASAQPGSTSPTRQRSPGAF